MSQKRLVDRVAQRTRAYPNSNELVEMVGTALLASAVQLTVGLALARGGVDSVGALSTHVLVSVCVNLAVLAPWTVGASAFGCPYAVRAIGVQVILLGNATYPVVAFGLATHPRVAAGGLMVAATAVIASLVWPLAHAWPVRNDARNGPSVVTLAIGGTIILATVWLLAFRVDAFSNLTFGIQPEAVALAVLGGTTAAAFVLLRSKIPWSDQGLLVGIVSCCVLGSVLPLASAAPRQAPTSDPSRPTAAHNVILITVDTLRADAVGAYDDLRSTPFLDALAADAIVFENARSVASWTRPGISSILTGLSPLVHRAVTVNSKLPEAVTTLAEDFKARGYYTAALGKNGVLLPEFGTSQGFDDYTWFRSTANRLPTVSTAVLSRLGLVNRLPTTEQLTDIALAKIAAFGEGPYFFWLHYYDPHDPYEPPSSFLPADAAAEGRFEAMEDVRAGLYGTTLRQRDEIRRLYDAEVRYVDHNIGRILEFLRHAGGYSQTVIAVTSDHGEEFWEHGSIGHGHSLFDEVLRVPLLLKLAGESVVGRRAQPVTTEILRPVLLSAAHGTWSEGRLAQFATGPRTAAGMLYYENKVALLKPSGKYIRSTESGESWRYLYATDPHEKYPLVEGTTYVDQWEEQLSAAIASARDQARELGIDTELEETLSPETLEDLRAMGYIR